MLFSLSDRLIEPPRAATCFNTKRVILFPILLQQTRLLRADWLVSYVQNILTNTKAEKRVLVATRFRGGGVCRSTGGEKYRHSSSP